MLNQHFKKDFIQYNSYFANYIYINNCKNSGTKGCKYSCKNYKEI